MGRRARKRAARLSRYESRMMYAMLVDLMTDWQHHAELLVQGRTPFRNALAKTLKDSITQIRDDLRTVQDKAERRRMELKLLTWTRMASDAALDHAWALFVGPAWMNTLAGMSREIGFQIPWNTTPDMVLRYYMKNEPPEPPPPDERKVTIRSGLSDAEHAQVWRGSARERTGTFREIMASSKIPEIERGIRSGEVVVRDAMGRELGGSAERERMERVNRDRKAKGKEPV